MKLTRPIHFTIDDAHPERCPKGCPLWNEQGNWEYCDTEALTTDKHGHSLRTPECLAEAKETP